MPSVKEMPERPTDADTCIPMEPEELSETPFKRLCQMNKPEWHYIAIGCVAAFVQGGAQPTFSLLYSESINILGENDFDKQKDKANELLLYYGGVGFMILLSSTMQSYFLALAGEALTQRVRSQLFSNILRQEMGWFDLQSTGSLCTQLSVDASLIQNTLGPRLGAFMMTLSSIFICLSLSLFYGWNIALVCIGAMPLIIAAGFLLTKIQSGMANEKKGTTLEASKVSVQAIENIRTVAALSKEETLLELYSSKLLFATNNIKTKIITMGLIFGQASCSVFIFSSICVSYGAYLVEEGVQTGDEIIKVISFLFFTGALLGNSFTFLPDIGKAKIAAVRVFQTLDRVTEIDAYSSKGEKPDLKTFKGNLRLENATFRYKSRPKVKILRGMNISIRDGQTVALVGSSGCGKSTIVSLLLRFYNLNEGALILNNYNIQDLNIKWLRRQIGLVSQEPVLFRCSIRDNIAYGDNSRDDVSMEEIIRAARAANIHNFIANLPQGYDTLVGEKGSHLSGGEKQRIAIARALLRNPKLLLLDEATSALDTESEKLVQDALVKARQGRTCITIAHRLSTIQDSDLILVIDNGTVVERGNHEKLMALKGFYYNLNRNKRKAL